jgi:hypothetical protein
VSDGEWEGIPVGALTVQCGTAKTTTYRTRYLYYSRYGVVTNKRSKVFEGLPHRYPLSRETTKTKVEDLALGFLLSLSSLSEETGNREVD